MEKGRLVSFLKKIVSSFKSGNNFSLRENANKAIEEAALSNDKGLATVAMIGYCLHKMASKQHIVRHGRWQEIKHDILFDLEKAANAIQKGNREEFDYRIKAAIDSVKTTDKNMGNYVQNLFEKARVKYASEAYSLGLGLGQAAALTGADKKELLRYIGVTKMADREAVTKGIGERLREFKRKLGGAR